MEKGETRPNMKQRTKGEMGRPKATLLEIAIKQTHIVLNRGYDDMEATRVMATSMPRHVVSAVCILLRI